MTPADALRRLFGPDPLRADWFTPSFLQAVPLPQVAGLVAALTQAHGPLQGVDGTAVRLRDATVPVDLTLEGGRIAGLWLYPPSPNGGLLAQLDALRALPGRTAALVVTGGATVAAHEADVPLSVGSAFKLVLLRALALATQAGTVADGDVVRLRAPWRSLPSGILQAWPDGVPVTLGTLAALMASVSDNTAADALLAVLGRAAAEAVSPRNTPFLSTRDMFVIAADPALRAAWSRPEARRQVLMGAQALPLPAATALPVAAEVGWHLTMRELCDLLDQTHHLAPFRINPGPAGRSWDQVAYKGGSQPGVLCLAARVEAPSTSHTVALAWNHDAPLDEARLVGMFRGVLEALRRTT